MEGQRGLFPDPANPRQDFVKRVVGLPGDTLRVENEHPFINGWRVPRCYVGREHLTGTDGRTTEVEIFVEFLESAQYLIALDVSRSPETEGPYEIKDGEGGLGLGRQSGQ